jgi:hypothetical protein
MDTDETRITEWQGGGEKKSRRDFIIQPGVDAQRLRRVVIAK